MPTTYAHWRFGDKCIDTLDNNLKNIITNNREIFDFGVHGPDIFFYYNCLKHNEINQFGTNLHDIPFKDTLSKIKPLYQKCDNKDAALSYLLGFVCHFTLDSYCHGYIDLKDETCGVPHGKIESQLDRYFLKKDGYNPVKKSVTFSLKPSKEIAHVIYQLFPEINEKDVYKTLKDQLFYLNLLKDDSDIKRWILNKAMDLAHAYSFKELLITKEDDPRCLDTNERLNKLFNIAVKHYPLLANNLVDYLNDKCELDAYYHNHFCPKEDYKQIPILSYEDELKYSINEFQK
ncbi:MAG: zinc dependent phospholipase C family protein [Erysipelotrichaceae bacterium]|nr:zinc dependent phospholipase C family protein [Erysipelotrichaceae bacterium]